MSTHLSELYNLVSWEDLRGETFGRLESQYLETISWKFGQILNEAACEKNHDIVDCLMARLACVEPSVLNLFLLTPETSRRVVLADRHPVNETVKFAVAWFKSMTYDGSGPRTGLVELERVFKDTTLLADPSNLGPHEATFRTTRMRVKHMADLISEAAPSTYATVCRSMRELVLRVEQSSWSHFRSNSPQGYVGRAVITNAHAADDVALAEALVHESMHGLVGMSEAIGLVLGGDKAWITDHALYDGESRTISPWTGTALDLPTYLHACFVWFGLLQLWSRTYSIELFDRDRVRNRISRAVSGFTDNAALRQIWPYKDRVNPVLTASVDDMCRSIDGCINLVKT